MYTILHIVSKYIVIQTSLHLIILNSHEPKNTKMSGFTTLKDQPTVGKYHSTNPVKIYLVAVQVCVEGYTKFSFPTLCETWLEV